MQLLQRERNGGCAQVRNSARQQRRERGTNRHNRAIRKTGTLIYYPHVFFSMVLLQTGVQNSDAAEERRTPAHRSGIDRGVPRQGKARHHHLHGPFPRRSTSVRQEVQHRLR